MPYEFEITVVLGPGYKYKDAIFKDMTTTPELLMYILKLIIWQNLCWKRMLFSSAGRTMYEIAMIGTPAIIISQNYRVNTFIWP